MEDDTYLEELLIVNLAGISAISAEVEAALDGVEKTEDDREMLEDVRLAHGTAYWALMAFYADHPEDIY